MRAIVVAVSAAIAISASPAGAETINCTEIAAVPVTLGAPGSYCLKGNISINKGQGFAIRIGADNVTIDLNGFSLRNTRGTATTASGIFARDKRNIVIRNGTIEGFFRGIHLDNIDDRSANHLVEHIRAIDNGFAGIQVEGENLVVRNNQVSQTGPAVGATSAIGIFVSEFKNARVSGNTVRDTEESAFARGIFTLTGSEVVIESNMVSDTHTAGATYGIHVQSTARAHIRNNQLINTVSGITGIRASGTTGITCTGNYIDAFNNVHSTCNNISGGLETCPCP